MNENAQKIYKFSVDFLTDLNSQIISYEKKIYLSANLQNSSGVVRILIGAIMVDAHRSYLYLRINVKIYKMFQKNKG